MKILVFLKQVPDNTKLKFNDNGPIREGAEMMLNPFDEYALETALRMKEAAGAGATVTAMSVGEASAREILKKAIAAGCDDAFLLSDPAFLNGDGAMTAQVLVQAVKTLAPDFNLLVFGQMSLDLAAGQTGPMVAELLNLPSLTYCKGLELANPQTLKVKRESERGVETHEMPLPGAVCMIKCDYELRTANIKGVMKANKTEIPVKTAADLSLAAPAASTQVVKLWQRPAKTGGMVVDGSDAKAAVGQLIGYLKEAKVL